jgi:aminoglycoside phosphotransferase (APT) family kinase protein
MFRIDPVFWDHGRMPPGGPTATGLALARAKYALDAAGLPTNIELTRANSVTNEVWLSSEYVIRVNRKPDHRLRREALLGPLLPPEVKYPKIVAYGAGSGFDWLIVGRSPGRVLSRCWAAMPESQRRDAVRQLAGVLKALHRTTAPDGLADVGAPQLLECGKGTSPVAPLLAGLERARALPNVGAGLIDLLTDTVRTSQALIEPFDVPTLIHGDLTFENVLWDGDTIAGLIDFEWSRAAPPDLELDVLLRFCAFPELHVAEDYLEETTTQNYRVVPQWLRDHYVDLFTTRFALERLRLYAIAFDVRQLLSSPPTAPLQDLPPSHELQRLNRLAHRRSYLDNFASGQEML